MQMQFLFSFKKPAVQQTSKTGKAYFTQDAQCVFYGKDGKPEDLPRKVNFYVGEKIEDGYAPGDYFLAPQSIGVDDRDGLVLKRAVLVPKGAAVAPGAGK